MYRQDFEELELQVQQSDLPLKLYLQQIGVSYSTYPIGVKISRWQDGCQRETGSYQF